MESPPVPRPVPTLGDGRPTQPSGIGLSLSSAPSHRRVHPSGAVGLGRPTRRPLPSQKPPALQPPWMDFWCTRRGLMAACVHVSSLTAGRTPKWRYAESLGGTSPRLYSRRVVGRMKKLLASGEGPPDSTPELRPAERQPRTTSRAANIVRGPTSARRFAAQSGPLVLSYGLTVMTSSYEVPPR